MAYADRDPRSDLRITFDTGIAYRMDNLTPCRTTAASQIICCRKAIAVMEVKVTVSVPFWLSTMIGDHDCILQGHSKYSNALEDGDPVLHQMLAAVR